MHPSVSEETLFNPDPPTTLIFTNSSTLNTTLLLNNRPYFRVSTLDAAGARTTIANVGTNEVLVTLKKRSLCSNTVTFANKYDGKTLKQKEWLVEGKCSDRLPKWSIHTPRGNFVWRKDLVHRLALCPEKDLDNPVAHTQYPTIDDYSIPMGLLLSRGTESFWDEIVASLLILETRLRVEEMGMGIGDAQFSSGAHAQMTSGAF